LAAPNYRRSFLLAIGNALFMSKRSDFKACCVIGRLLENAAIVEWMIARAINLSSSYFCQINHWIVTATLAQWFQYALHEGEFQ